MLFQKDLEVRYLLLFYQKNFLGRIRLVLEAPNIINLEQCEPIIVHQTLSTILLISRMGQKHMPI